MPTLNANTLRFSFPTVHKSASCTISFVRTLRVPDHGTYQLPAGFGNFPLEQVQEGSSLAARGGVMLPMYQSEALWIHFQSNLDPERRVRYPMAVKVAAGKRSAVSGGSWVSELVKNDYLVLPTQNYLDGFVVASGLVRQFVAMPLGFGVTAEEQLSGEAEFGGLQIQVFPMKTAEFERRFPKPAPKPAYRGTDQYARKRVTLSCATRGTSSSGLESTTMGMAAGGLLSQQVHEDTFGLGVWDQSHTDRVFVHLLNSLGWQELTGSPPPTQPITVEEYTSNNIPWFDTYREGPSLQGTGATQSLKSLGEIKDELGLPTTSAFSVSSNQVVKLPGSIPDGEW